jgi:hypothetical protein
MAMPTAAEAAQRWVQNTSGAGQRYTDGVKAVTVSPGVLAARSKDLWLRNTTAAVNKFATNAGRVTLQDWQEAAATKGAARLASGVQAAQGAYEGALSKLLPFIAQTVNALPARGDLEANVNRMTAFVRGMAKYQK